MANIKVSSITKKEPPCPGPAPKKPKRLQPAPTDAPGRFPPPPPFFMPGPCCPSTTQVVDNITVLSTTPDTIEVQEGTCQGMKAYGVGAKTFEGIGTSGMVPIPQPGDENKVLAGDGSWAEIIITQSDWEQEDYTQPDYIKNKPDIDAMIDDAVSEERERATTAENRIQTEIDTETTRATDAETALGNRITAETTRAEGVETTLSGEIDNRYTKTETDTALSAKQDKPSSSTAGDIATFGSDHSTVDSGKTFLDSTGTWDGTSDELVPTAKTIQSKLDEKYTRPETGIPSEDLDSTVNASLGKADSALQGIKLAGAETVN